MYKVNVEFYGKKKLSLETMGISNDDLKSITKSVI